jgi:hypothetical protein
MEAHWKALMRCIKYVLDTRMYALKIRAKLKDGIFHLEGFSDSDYAGDRETRYSVYGYIVYFCGAPISWKSKSSKSVTLSSTEAEYFAVSETAKELMFVYGLITGMGMLSKLETPFTLRMDNTGAIYLANNHTTGQRTKHINICTHYVRDLIDKCIARILFVRTADNDADLHTKNLTEEKHHEHANKNVDDLYEQEET